MHPTEKMIPSKSVYLDLVDNDLLGVEIGRNIINWLLEGTLIFSVLYALVKFVGRRYMESVLDLTSQLFVQVNSHVKDH